MIITLSNGFAQIERKSTKDSLLKEWSKLDTFQKRKTQAVPEFAFNAVLIWDGEIVSSKRGGFADRERSLILDNKTIYPWASISKMFTSVAILRLIERGKINIADPVIKYLPELKEAKSKYGSFDQVKIFHLINHTSGLDWRPLGDTLKAKYNTPKQRKTWKAIQPNLKYITLMRKPGSKYAYNNGAYSLLGRVIANVTGESFTQYITRNIFKPLGMKTAHFGKSPEKLFQNLASSYLRKKNDSLITTKTNISHGLHEANGGVKASLEDMLKFMDFLRFRKRKQYLKDYNKVLSWKTIKKYYHEVDLEEPQIKYSLMYKNKEGATSRAFGFLHSQVFNSKLKLFGHTGYFEEYQSLYLVRTDIPLAVILMVNNSGESGTKDYIISNSLYRSIINFISRNHLNLNFYDWEKAFKKLEDNKD